MKGIRHYGRIFHKAFVGKWELWDSSKRMAMQVPGITERGWIEVQNKGKKLEAYLLLKSGTFNLKFFPLYVKRAICHISKYLKS